MLHTETLHVQMKTDLGPTTSAAMAWELQPQPLLGSAPNVQNLVNDYHLPNAVPTTPTQNQSILPQLVTQDAPLPVSPP